MNINNLSQVCMLTFRNFLNQNLIYMKLKSTLILAVLGLFTVATTAQESRTADESYSHYDRLTAKADKDALGGEKAIDAVVSAYSGYTADATVTIPFELVLNNEDFEYGDEVTLTFPAGFTIESVSNDDVFGPSFDDPDGPDGDPEPYNGIDGQTVSWGDDDNSFGGITPGAVYSFAVTVTVDAGVTGDQTIDWTVSGDGFGPNPQDGSGSVTIGEGLSCAGIVATSPDHETLELLLSVTGLTSAVAELDPLTVFAPTDQAFTDLETANPGITDALLADLPLLTNILLYHVANVEAFSGDLTDGQEVETLEENGFSVTIGVDGMMVTVNGENVSAPDNDATNGVVHVIDGVLIPANVVTLPLDFEQPVEDYSILGFGGAEDTGVIPNPDPSGVNTSENVWQQTQNSAAPELFAGAVLDLNVAADFSESGTVAMDVWTPQVTTAVTLRFEVADNAPPEAGMERTVNTTETEAWETLTFDFTDDPNIGNEFVRVVVFFNLGSANTDDTFYADNIRVQPLPTIFEIVEGSDVHETLETALTESGLDAVTNDPEADLTLFAPTDEAFAALPAGVLDDLLADPTGALANVLLYHVVGGTNLSGDLMDGMEVLTAQGETVTVSINGDVITINDAEVTVIDLTAGNGVVHVIDAVLVPATCTIFAGGPYTNFNTAFGGAPAPTDGICPFNVITGFQSWASEAYLADGATEGTTYTFGLTGGDIGAWDPAFVIIDGATGEVVASETEGFSITWTAPADGDYIWIIQEEGLCGNQTDNNETNNGFPYMTCLSEQSITDIVVASDIHETLEAAVIAAGLDGTLGTDGPFTLFAPTDDAFDNLPDGLLDQLLADPDGLLTDVLLHHVVDGVAYSTDLSDGQVLETLLAGDDLTVGISETEVTITSSLGTVAIVVTPDVVASNGVVHIISEVLAPTVLNVDNISSVDRLSVFPNPTADQFTVDVDLNSSERLTIDFINVVGQVVKTVDLGKRSVGLNREYIDVSNLSEGIYFMNLTVGNQQATTKVQVVR